MRQITFTRFVAAMTVVVFHWALHTPALKVAIFDYRLLLGPTMVSYFFVLSGVIMAAVYYRPGVAFDPWTYWGKRVARIYPVYLVGVAWMAVLLHAGIGDTRHDWKALLLSALMLQAWIPAFALSVNAPGWSLSVEAFFYLLFPFALAAVSRMRRGLAIAASIAIFWLASQVIYHWALMRLFANAPVVGHEFLHYNPLMHLSSFLVGLGAGVWVSRHAARVAIARSARPSIVPLGIIALAVALIIAIALNFDRINTRLGIPLSPTNGLLAPLFALFIAALAVDGSWLSRLLGQGMFVLLGEISYAVYILHIPVAWSVRSVWNEQFAVAHPVAAFSLYLGVLLVVAYASFRWMETPLREWLRKRLTPAAGP